MSDECKAKTRHFWCSECGEPLEPHKELAQLRESLARVTTERDRAEAAADKWRNDLEQMTAERDEARAQLAAMDIVTGPWGIGTMAIGCTCDRSAEEALKCPVHR